MDIESGNVVRVNVDICSLSNASDAGELMISVPPRGPAWRCWRSALDPLSVPGTSTAILGVAAILCASVSHISFAGVTRLVLLASLMFVGGVVWRRFGRTVVDAGGRWRGDVFLRAGEASGLFALTAMSALAFEVLSYLSARIGFPYQDAVFTRADAFLGFHWTEWAHFVNAHPLLHFLFAVAYQSFGVQIVFVFFALACISDRRRGIELYCVFAVVGIVTCVVSGALPAIGAGPYLTGVPEIWTHDLTAVRVQGSASFDVSHLAGIVSLPSFHAALAVLLAWATRRTGIFGSMITALNTIMILSVPSEGGHYLIDAIAGVIVAGTAIAGVHLVIYSKL